MDFGKLFDELKAFAPNMLNSCCIINGAIMDLEEIQKMGIHEFSLRSKMNMPMKLYKYFPNIVDSQTGINYSLKALKDNTVFMQSPSNFDDVYDSDISIDFLQYERLRLIEYCRRCRINIDSTNSTQEIGNLLLRTLTDSYRKGGTFSLAFKVTPVSELEKLSTEHFQLALSYELNKTNDIGISLKNVIQDDYKHYIERLKNKFRISCFTTSPYSQLMWGAAYADCHRGFCLEYTILPNDPKYQEAYFNLFPLVYCKTRPNMTELLAKAEDMPLNFESMWNIYFHGVLRKSIDWAFQNEWRLLLPFGSNNTADYNVPFFPITKVFLGNRMSPDKRAEIIKICHDKKYPYVGVMRNQSFFEMQDCSTLCEKCDNYLSKIKASSTKV